MYQSICIYQHERDPIKWVKVCRVEKADYIKIHALYVEKFEDSDVACEIMCSLVF